MDLVLWRVIILLVAIHWSIACSAQDDDLDGQHLAPTLDALERFREDPLCLRCTAPSTLTQIPGISQRTASRIIAACRSPRITTIDHLADSICASPEQFLMLTACTTLTCTCQMFLRALRTRVRLRSTDTLHHSVRVDATYAFGTAGAVTSRVNDLSAASAWITASLPEVDISIGDIALVSGTGLLLGTARTLQRRGVDVIPPSSPMIATRPWPSTAFDNAPRGAVALWTSSSLPIAIGGSMWYDRSAPMKTINAAVHVGVQTSDVAAQVTMVRSVNGSLPSEALSLTLTHEGPAVRTLGEVRMRPGALEGIHAFIGTSFDRLDVVGALWMYAPDVLLDFGTSALGSSQPRNQRGIHVAAHQRFASRFSLAASLTMSERITRTYLDPLPPRSTELRCDLEVLLARATLLRLRVVHRRSVESVASSDGRIMAVHTYPSVRLDCEHAASRATTIRARIDIRSAASASEAPVYGMLMSLMVRTQIAGSITASAQVVQWRAASYDVASRVSTLGVPGTFDMLVATDAGMAVHLQARVALPWDVYLTAHARHERRAATTTAQWTLQAEWRWRNPLEGSAQSEKRPIRVGLMNEVFGD